VVSGLVEGECARAARLSTEGRVGFISIRLQRGGGSLDMVNGANKPSPAVGFGSVPGRPQQLGGRGPPHPPGVSRRVPAGVGQRVQATLLRWRQ